MAVSTDILWGVLEALFTMYFFAAMGWLFHKFGYLDHLTDLAQICFSYFLPCYSFVAVARALDWESFKDTWSLFLLGPMHIFLGFTVGWLLLSCFDMPPYQKRLLQMSIACTNIGEVVVTLVDVLGRTDLLASADFYPEESGEARAERGVGLIQVYMTAWNLVMWTMVWSYIQVPADLVQPAALTQCFVHDSSLGTRAKTDGSRPRQESEMSMDGSVDLLNHAAGAEVVLKNPTTCSTSSATQAVLSVKLKHRADGEAVSCQQAREIVLNVAKSPIIIACVLGLVVALVPFLRALFFSADESRAPLGFLFRMLEGIGRGYLPGVWLVVGAELRQGLLVQVQAMQAEGKQSLWEMVDKPIITVVLARLILVPLLNFGAIFLLRSFGAVSSEEMFTFVALSTPIGPTSSTFQLIMEVLHAPHSRYVSFTVLVQFMCALLILPFTTFGIFVVMDA